MIPSRAAFTLALLNLLAACASRPADPALANSSPSPPLAAQPTAAIASQPAAQIAPQPAAEDPAGQGVDGLYRGTSTRFRAARRNCPHPGLVEILVQGNQFEYRWNPTIDIAGVVAPDGTMSGQGSDIALTGRWDGARMEGDVISGACGLHFTVTKGA